VHVLDQLGYNTGDTTDMAAIVSGYLDREDLVDVTIVATARAG